MCHYTTCPFINVLYSLCQDLCRLFYREQDKSNECGCFLPTFNHNSLLATVTAWEKAEIKRAGSLYSGMRQVRPQK